MSTSTKVNLMPLPKGIDQSDVTAIQTAFTHFKQWAKNHNSVDVAQLLSDTDSSQDIMTGDPAAFAYVAGKYGYTPTGERIKGVKADPAWIKAMMDGPFSRDDTPPQGLEALQNLLD